jgi:hypothetical protein
VKLSLLELTETLRDYGDDPGAFDETIFLRLQQDSEVARNKALMVLERLTNNLPHLPPSSEEPIRAQRPTIVTIPIQQRSNPRTPRDNDTFAIVSLAPLSLPTTPISNADRVGEYAFPPALASPITRGNRLNIPSLPTTGLSSYPTDADLPLIDKEDVHHRLSSNEEWLERRSLLRVQFQLSHPEVRSSNSSSITSARGSVTSMTQGSSTIAIANRLASQDTPQYRTGLTPSPVLSSSSVYSTSPESTHDPRSVAGFVPQGLQFPAQTSSNIPFVRSSTGSSSSDAYKTVALDDQKSLSSHMRVQVPPSPSRRRPMVLSQHSEEMIFGPPDTPPLSGGRISQPDGLSSIPTLTEIDRGVEDGLEVAPLMINRKHYSDGLMLADENITQSTPPISIKSIDYPIKGDSSFFQMGGWCEGARLQQNDSPGAFKIVSTPTGYYTSTRSARCAKCLYEVSLSALEKDYLNDRSGIFTHHQISWRTRFLQKCHLPAKSIDEGVYGCPFCVEDGKTIDPYDATVFFTPTQFLKHLDKHTNRLRPVTKVRCLSGKTSELDFDIHFLDTDYESVDGSGLERGYSKEVEVKLASRPTAIATQAHWGYFSKYQARDPEGKPTLRFAKGAKIMGIIYPIRFKGDWCSGYHDGEKG